MSLGINPRYSEQPLAKQLERPGFITLETPLAIFHRRNLTDDRQSLCYPQTEKLIHRNSSNSDYDTTPGIFGSVQQRYSHSYSQLQQQKPLIRDLVPNGRL